MEPNKEDQLNKPLEPEEEEDQEEMTGKNKANLNDKLVASAKKGEYEEVEKCLKKKADLHHEEPKKKWTALVWACCTGHIKIVKLLLSKGAAQPYLQLKPENRVVIPGQTRDMKPHPLHWACFKNRQNIVYILLKMGLHWEDVDNCGNNSVMLCAAGNFLTMFEMFLQYGVELQCKNSRGHTVKDLTTNPQIRRLAQKASNARECCVSKIAFKEKEIKYWCWVCRQFANKDNFQLKWVLQQLHGNDDLKIDGRCNGCWSRIKKVQSRLQEAINDNEQIKLGKTIEEYKSIWNQIQIRFREECLRVHEKLIKQNEILDYIDSLKKIDNYKIILKSANKIKALLKNALPLGIDEHVIQVAEKQIQRLNAQRNLRFQIDNIDTSTATREGVSKLEEVFSEAQTKSVATQYLEVAGEIKDKMAKSILAQDILQMFTEYPKRPDPYPDPLVIDFKTKRPIDPATKKPTDPANLIPKKKKGKKGAQFVIPEWAADLKDMNSKIKEQEELVAERETLGLSEELCVHSA